MLLYMYVQIYISLVIYYYICISRYIHIYIYPVIYYFQFLLYHSDQLIPAHPSRSWSEESHHGALLGEGNGQEREGGMS